MVVWLLCVSEGGLGQQSEGVDNKTIEALPQEHLRGYRLGDFVVYEICHIKLERGKHLSAALLNFV